MQTTALLDIALRRNEWLAERQATISSNIANVNTPNYHAKDISAFESVMASGEGLVMSATHPSHITQGTPAPGRAEIVEVQNKEQLITGNNVNIEEEFFKSGEVMRDYSMNTQIIKAFHRMQLASTKV